VVSSAAAAVEHETSDIVLNVQAPDKVANGTPLATLRIKQRNITVQKVLNSLCGLREESQKVLGTHRTDEADGGVKFTSKRSLCFEVL
jgi:hypothetical protein